MSKPKSVLDHIPRRPAWANGERRAAITPLLDRLDALEQRVAALDHALDITIRRMGVIQAELDLIRGPRQN